MSKEAQRDKKRRNSKDKLQFRASQVAEGINRGARNFFDEYIKSLQSMKQEEPVSQNVLPQGYMMGSRNKTRSLPTPQEQTLSSYNGYVPSSTAEAKAIAEDEIRRDEVMREQAEIESRRMMEAQAERQRVAAYEAAIRQKAQAARRKISDQNARNAVAADTRARTEAENMAASQSRQAADRKNANFKRSQDWKARAAAEMAVANQNAQAQKRKDAETERLKARREQPGERPMATERLPEKQTVVRSVDKRTEAQKKNSFGAYVRSKKGN